MTIYVKQSGSWEKVREVHANQSGSWTHSDESIHIKDGGSWKQVYQRASQEFTSSGTWVVPEGVYSIRLSAAGGGGGGGGAYYSKPGWGGSGAGYCDKVECEVTPASTITVAIGTGGIGHIHSQFYPPNDGEAGTATTVAGLNVAGNVTASTVTFNGGNGGREAYDPTALDGGTVTGLTGGKQGTKGMRDPNWGYGGLSLGGSCASTYATGPYNDPSSTGTGVNGDDSRGCPYAAGKGSGAGAADDGATDGKGGDGADGYVLIEWGNWDFATGSQSYTTGSGNFTVPADITKIEVDMVAGGGGGGGGSDYGSGGGGSGGWYYNEVVDVTPGQVIAYSVGAGGVGGATGTAGTNTTFGALTCTGGGAGSRNAAGSGGTPNGMHSEGHEMNTRSSSHGNNVGGPGGSSPFGHGGNGGVGGGPGSNGSPGNTGTGYGAGGGGGGNNVFGGNGTGGYIKIRW